MSQRLELSGITKAYPSVVANDGIDLSVAPGEIHALLGENGAGKSTLMKIVYGVVRPDAGRIVWEGREVQIASPAEARRLGIGMVFQHFSLFETLTIAENIALSLDTPMPRRQLEAKVREVSQRYGLAIEPERLVHSMSVGERQRVEIVRCLLQEPRLVIMDEPTSVLTPQAVEKLFETLRQLKAQGVSILYISHKLDEIRALCDHATVLRGGKVTGTAVPAQESNDSLARLMLGGALPEFRPAPRTPGAVRLAIRSLSFTSPDPFGTSLRDICLEVKSGEIVGIAGVSGNGQKELLAALSGEERSADAGAVVIENVPAGRLDAARRRRLGLTFVPEERLGRGAVPPMSLADNALLTGASHPTGMTRRGLVQPAVMREFAARVIAAFRVKAGGPEAAAESLSGGNLQKFIVGRETSLAPRVMIVAQPTWGVDVGAAQLIRQALIDLRNQGVALLVISEELDELFMISDRIAVIAGGRLSPTRLPGATSVEEIGRWMSGEFANSNPAPGERDAATA